MVPCVPSSCTQSACNKTASSSFRNPARCSFFPCLVFNRQPLQDSGDSGIPGTKERTPQGERLTVTGRGGRHCLETSREDPPTLLLQHRALPSPATWPDTAARGWCRPEERSIPAWWGPPHLPAPGSSFLCGMTAVTITDLGPWPASISPCPAGSPGWAAPEGLPAPAPPSFLPGPLGSRGGGLDFSFGSGAQLPSTPSAPSPPGPRFLAPGTHGLREGVVGPWVGETGFLTPRPLLWVRN